MPIKISKTLTSKLPAEERADIKDFVRAKAGGVCFLCGEPINEAADSLVLDHDVPQSEDGPTSRENLNLVHQSCNAAKRNSPTIDIRPILKLSAFLRKSGPLLKYDGVIPHFGITPAPTAISSQGQHAKFDFPDGTSAIVPVHREKNRRREYSYVYVDLPRAALYNDPQCQPRNVKISHISAIYADLQINPLHEAPGCRTEPVDGPLHRIAMFDGQHKSIATWMMGRERIMSKIYLDLPASEAIELVNSVQAKIRKLPLSPFELAAKMADEWTNKLRDYEALVGSENASEAGFIDHLPPSERKRGLQAFQAAMIQDILDDQSLQFTRYLSETAGGDGSIKENAFKTKVLEPLVYAKPLVETGDAQQTLREQERMNIVRLLNTWVQFAFEPDVPREDLSPQQLERIRRVKYQAALAHVTSVIRQLFSHILYISPPWDLLKGKPDDTAWAKLEAGIKRIAEHPVWTAALDSSKKMRAIDDALSKNQGVQGAFDAVRLDAAYAAGLVTVTADDLA